MVPSSDKATQSLASLKQIKSYQHYFYKVLGLDLTIIRQSEYNDCRLIRQGKTQARHERLPPVKDVVSKSVIPALQKIFDNSKRERLTTVVNKIHAETRRTSNAVRSKRFTRKQYVQRWAKVWWIYASSRTMPSGMA